jgi:hypothetical protein
MPVAAVKSVVITPDAEAGFNKKWDQMQDQIRRRAFELYCHRDRPGTAEADWLQAERETILCPLAGIEDRDRDIRITAAVPDTDASHLIERQSMFPSKRSEWGSSASVAIPAVASRRPDR